MLRLKKLLLVCAAVTAAGLPFLVASCKTNDISDSNNAAGVIGPSGGELKGPNGLTVLFPAGAVPTPTQFTLTTITDDYPTLGMGQTLESAVYSLEPHGFLFSGAVTVSMPVNPGVTSGQVLHSSCMASNACEMWDSSVMSVSFQGDSAIFSTPSFSLYAVVSATSHTPNGSCEPMAISAAACFTASTISCTGLGNPGCSCTANQMPACAADGGPSGNMCTFVWTCDDPDAGIESCSATVPGSDAGGGQGSMGQSSDCTTACATQASAAAAMAAKMNGACGTVTGP